MTPILNLTGRELRPKERAAGAVDLTPPAQQDLVRLMTGQHSVQWRAEEIASLAARAQAAKGVECRALLDPGPMRAEIQAALRVHRIRVYRPRNASYAAPERGGKTLPTYATPAEILRMRALRERLGVSQTRIAHSLYTPLRTWQQWESGRGKMHRIVWQAAMRGLESYEERPHAEARAKAQRAALGLPPLEP